jgi:hypothetical protein
MKYERVQYRTVLYNDGNGKPYDLNTSLAYGILGLGYEKIPDIVPRTQMLWILLLLDHCRHYSSSIVNLLLH